LIQIAAAAQMHAMPTAHNAAWPPNISRETSAIALISAPRLMMLAIASSITTQAVNQNGVWSRSVAARPAPVTLPMRAQISCTATMNGRHSSTVHPRM